MSGAALSFNKSSVRVLQGDSRRMPEIPDDSVHLVVTSPPYWQIKDYGAPGQIGWGQSLHDARYDLSRVWAECARVLLPGRRLCVNIGDQFARAVVYGRYKVIPLHAEVIAQAQAAGLDYLGAIIWQKKTTMNSTGGAVVMGSFPHPTNGVVELDYEYILIFKKPPPKGFAAEKISPERKSASRLTTEEWKQFFSGHWTFGGTRQANHEAMFPEELPRRLIRMFSYVGETVLDPFLGSGTTAKAAIDWDRSAVGFEINPEFVPLLREKLDGLPLTIEERSEDVVPLAPPSAYRPQTEDADALAVARSDESEVNRTYKVREIIDEHTLRLDSGLAVSLLGIRVPPAQAATALSYFYKYLRGKKVILRFENGSKNADIGNGPTPAYVRLSNKLFINRKMIEMGLARADRAQSHKFRDRFIAAEEGVFAAVNES